MKEAGSTSTVARHGIGQGLVEGVQEVAETGDRVFLSVTRFFGRLGGWAGREVDVVVDSAKAAATTTAEVSRQFLPFGSAQRRPPTVTANPWGATRSTPGPAEPSGEPASFDLLSAVPARRGGPAGPPTLVGPSTAGAGDGEEHPPGVLPMLHGLGRLMAEHRKAGYRTLARDEHFWALLGLLHGSLSSHSSPGQKGETP